MQRLMHRVKFLFKLHRSIPFLKDFFLSKEVSFGKKFLSVVLFIGYFWVPFDAIPDFLVVVGLVDDIAVLTFILQQMIKMAPDSLKEKHEVDREK